MPRPQGFEWCPFDVMWYFLSSGMDPTTKQYQRGRVRITDQPVGGQRVWDIDVLAMDGLAKEYQSARNVKSGQPVQMPDGRVLEIPYTTLDNDADLWLQRQRRPGPQELLTIELLDRQAGKRVVMEKVSREWYEALLGPHVERRGAQPNVVLDFGNQQQLVVSAEFFDAMCKDYLRRRGDMMAVGAWPELIHVDAGQMEGPRPVEGRSNAFGGGVRVLQQQPGDAPAPVQQQGPMAHPAVENQDLV